MKADRDFKNILVYRIGHLGDTIVALPSFWEIRKNFPNSKLTLLTNCDGRNKNYVTAENILPKDGLFDFYVTYDNSAEKLNKIKVFAELLIKIRIDRYDSLFYLSTRSRTDEQINRDLNFFRLAGIKKVFGTDYLKKNQLNFNEPKPLPSVEPEYQFLLNSIENGLRDKNTGLNCDLRLDESEKNFSDEWLVKNCGKYIYDKKIVAVAPGSKWESKLWLEDNYVKVLKNLIDNFNIFPVIFGGREDFEAGERILSKLGRGANAAGVFSIRESAAALEKCLFYLGNDTGTMHLAATVKTKCVAIFAATDYQGRWHPFGSENQIFRKIVECEGCHTPQCFNDHQCLKLVGADEVYKACKEIIERERN